jgi:phage shock protein E
MHHPVYIDVREPNEFAAGHVPEAINIPLSRLSEASPELHNIPRDSHIIVYCRSGNRSNTALLMLQSLGYSNVHNGINMQQIESNYDV